MRGFSASELLEVWERGTSLDDVDRALLMLAWRLHGKSWAELGSLRLDERDRILLEVRSATFGSKVDAFAHCADCGESLECSLHAVALQQNPMSSIELNFWPGYTMRVPNSTDMRAAALCHNPRQAGIAIFCRCVHLTHSENGQSDEIFAENVTEAMFETYSAWLAEQAPGSEVLLELECPACSQRSSIVFDIASFFWREIEAAAARLVREVDALARMYGWDEAQILAMTSARRGLYLEAVGA